MPAAYDPQTTEDRIYRLWEEGGYFTPKIDPAKQPFTIIMPPPNVTGELHLGHALTDAIEDVFTRWHRMKGDPTLWLPGVDHAGIATQNVVERELAKEGLTRHDLGRQAFEERVWAWVARVRGVITSQHRKLGASADWSRERFTLDPIPQLAVRTVFAKMYGDGLIYRGERLINWCPRCQTALSDLEVEHEERQGHLWHIKYPLVDEAGRPTGETVTVATTRPETFVGDTAVTAHPADPRYQRYFGRKVMLPVIDRVIPFIPDEAVEQEFGTGALKVTPGHDPVDFEIAQRHGLPIINVMNPDGALNENAGPYAGMDRFEAREVVVRDLEELHYLEKIEPYTVSLGLCHRCHTVVEPLISNQWFVRMAPLARPAIEAVTSGQIRFVPERFVRMYLNWMENIRDWCISRQLWWGHRIPVWYCADCDGDKIPVRLRQRLAGNDGRSYDSGAYAELRAVGLAHEDIVTYGEWSNIAADVTPIVAVETPTECPRCHGSRLLQDSDVLDTWFSSGLWPFSTLGWPHDTEDLRYFYPTSLMETGYEIIFFWVARMIMQGLYCVGQIPFRTVYFHGTVRNERGIRMSKSLGTGVDPLEVIRKYGADALRFVLLTGSSPGNDMRLSEQRVEAGRNFANKLWNVARFVVTALGERTVEPLDRPPAGAPLEDRWILSRAGQLARLVTDLLERYEIGEAGRQVQDFLWGEFADWYIEMAKIRLRAGDESVLPVLASVLDACLRLLHPYMPFVTEEIWQTFRHRLAGAPEALIIAPFPDGAGAPRDEEAEAALQTVVEVVRAIRNIRAEKKVEPGRFIEAYVVADGARRALEVSSSYIETLARVRPLHIVGDPAQAPREQVATAVLRDAQAVVPLAGLFDLAQERARLQKQTVEAESEVARLEAKLANEQFRSRAPASVVAKEEARLAAARSRLDGLRDRLRELDQADTAP